MSGGSGTDPYYQKGSPKRDSKRKGQKKLKLRMIRKAKAEDVYRLYFKEGLSQIQVAKKLGVSLNTVQRVFKDNGWEARKRGYTDEDARHLYFDKGLTQKEVAQRIGIAPRTVIKIFRRNKWEPRPLRKANEKEGVRLRKKGLTQKEIAETLGVSRSAVQQLLRKQGLTGLRQRVKVDLDRLRHFYIEQRLTQKEAAKRLGISLSTFRKIVKKQGLISPRRQEQVDLRELRHLYLEERLSHKEVSEKLGVSVSTVRYLAKELGLTDLRKRTEVDAEQLRRFYADENLTQKEVAERLGVSVSTVRNLVRDLGLTGLRKQAAANADEIRHLYVEEKLSQREVAERLGTTLYHVQRLIKAQGLETRYQKKHKSDVEREQARKDTARNFRQKVHNLRNELFGRECKICGTTKEERILSIHRKDCTEHDPDALWRLWFLQALDPNEWVPLCTLCHLGTHWVNDDLGMDWPTVEARLDAKSHNDTQAGEPSSPSSTSTRSNAKKDTSSTSNEETVEEMRKAIFGEECHFCGTIPEGKRLVIHRKDGTRHRDGLLWSREQLPNLDPDEWVPLCQKHHRYVHWAMDELGFNWDNLESAFRRKKRDSGTSASNS